MKRILIALAVLASVQVAGAQNIETAKKNLEAAKAACENVKKAAKVATWINLGNKFIDAYNAPIGNAWVGADVTSLTLAMGNDKPVSTENVVLNGTTYTKQVYKDKNIYIIISGSLKLCLRWRLLKEIVWPTASSFLQVSAVIAHRCMDGRIEGNTRL